MSLYDDEPTGREGAGYDFEYEGTRETSCLICGRASAEKRIAHITTPGGLRLLLCDVCTNRWRGYGLVVDAA